MTTVTTTPPAPRFSRDESLGFLAWQLARQFEQALNRRLAVHGVNIAQFRVLLILWETTRASQKQMAQCLDVSQPTMANTLKRMERDGLVASVPHPSDGRSRLVEPTAKGRELRPVLLAQAQFVNAFAVARLSDAEAERLTRLVKQVIGDLQGSRG